MHQKVEGFSDKFAPTATDTSKTLAYYDQKQLLAQSFGTAKAQRKLASVLTNRVDDQPANENSSKGVRDQRVHEMANEVSKVAAEVKKAAVGSEAKKQQLYSRDALMPENVFDLLPYKETHEALKESDEDKLRELLCGFVVSIAKGVWEQSWDAINDKKEKKRILKALVYLDTLITLYRMPPQFEFAIDELSQRFRGI